MTNTHMLVYAVSLVAWVEDAARTPVCNDMCVLVIGDDAALSATLAIGVAL
jgi:hypothetical protein